MDWMLIAWTTTTAVLFFLIGHRRGHKPGFHYALSLIDFAVEAKKTEDTDAC